VGKRKDHNKVAEGLARGLSKREAVRQAGYSPMTAEKKASAIVKRPLVQSALTEALERRGATLERILGPLVDALDANVIVTCERLGFARETLLPDYDIRIRAADRLVGLYGGRPKSSMMPPPAAKGLTVIISKEDAPEPVTQQTSNVTIDRTKIQPTGTSSGDREPKIKITRVP
jgi:hypothetical protein